MNSLLNYKFNIQLDNWTPLTSVYHSFFSDDEIVKLREASNNYNDQQRTIVFLSFENRLATGGGLGAVVKILPDKIKENGERITFLSPFFRNISTMSRALEDGVLEKILDFNLLIDHKNVKCSVYKDLKTEVESYYVEIENYFNQSPTPYDCEKTQLLIEDSFAFCQSVPIVLQKLNKRDNLLIHANDWETAPSVITIKNAIIKNVLNSGKSVLTLHNSYDAEIKQGEDLRFLGKKSRASTVLQLAIPFLDAPISTVSWPFAIELTQDTLQQDYFASHLQYLFSLNPPVGVDNGQFIKVENSDCPEISDLKRIKHTFSKKLWKILGERKDDRIIGNINFNKSKRNKPILFMSGRMDLMQKGFDIIFHAFRRILRNKAVLVFSPSITNDREMASLGFFKNIAQELDGEIEIWPFRIPRDQYESFLKGSSYFIMPSLYEPFGAANEAYSNYTPVIARATGGLWAQVDPIKACSTPHYIRRSHDQNHDFRPTGLLFREDYVGNVDDWRAIMALPLENRVDNPLYSSMVENAAKALEKAIELYNNQSDYINLISNGYSKLSEFSWDKSVSKYKAIYNCVQRSSL